MKLCGSKRRLLLNKFGGKCAYCGCCILSRKWHADHVKPVNRVLKFARDKHNRTVMVPTGELYNPENDCEENLFPACSACNIDKSASPLEDWRKRLQDLSDNLRRNSSTFRHAERFGRVSINNHEVVFWFEIYESQAAL